MGQAQKVAGEVKLVMYLKIVFYLKRLFEVGRQNYFCVRKMIFFETLVIF